MTMMLIPQQQAAYFRRPSDRLEGIVFHGGEGTAANDQHNATPR
jgi:hypothetical protein